MKLTVENELELLRRRVQEALEALESGRDSARALRNEADPVMGMNWPGAYGYTDCLIGNVASDLARALAEVKS